MKIRRTKNGYRRAHWWVEHEMLATWLVMFVFAVITLILWVAV